MRPRTFGLGREDVTEGQIQKSVQTGCQGVWSAAEKPQKELKSVHLI